MTSTSSTNGQNASLEFKGVFPANPTPVHSDGRINEEALRAIFEDNISYGVNGFWVAGSTGEGPVFNEGQREAVARVAGETCSGRALTIMHVGAISTDLAVKGARAARKYGCDAVCCVPPFFWRPSTRSILDHYKAQHGMRIFVEPEGGLFVVMNVVPFVFLGIGGFIVVFLLRHWLRNRSPDSAGQEA